ALQNNVVSKMNMSYRRVAEGNFHVIRETKVPSALLEVGFIDNPSDAAKLKQSKYRQLAAEGIMLGALDYFR
ncbi:N-acetylmuramoyl-L-alanine amidase, partial [Microvirga sp. 3-52]|nr:N-acetylmuramoyl-L-alanine amidase [Microvirga sp. 3-52]